MSAVGERDISAQETAHLLLSEPLHSCTYSFISVSLDGSRQVCNQQGELQDTSSTMPSMLDLYASRTQLDADDPTISSLSFIQFVQKYSTVKKELRKRSKDVVVRTFPSFSPNSRSPSYGQYCKYQLIKFKPWTGFPANTWNGQPHVEQTDSII